MDVEAPPPSQEGFLKKHRNLLLASVAIIIFVVILVNPFVPIQYTVTQTRTRNLLYNSEVYGIYNVPQFVNVTNTDSIGGSFSVTMNMWLNNPFQGQQLQDTSTQSSFIQAGTTYAFRLPWIIVPPVYSFTYSVSAPTTQENYDVTQTKYESILALIENSLG